MLMMIRNDTRRMLSESRLVTAAERHPQNQSRQSFVFLFLLKICFLAWKKNLCRHYSITNKNSYTILETARMFSKKIKFLKARPGERYASALTNMNLSNKVYKYFGKIMLKDYIKEFKKKIN